MERFLVCHLINGTMKRIDHGRNQRLRDITDAEPDDSGIRMLFRKCLYLLCNG